MEEFADWHGLPLFSAMDRHHRLVTHSSKLLHRREQWRLGRGRGEGPGAAPAGPGKRVKVDDVFHMIVSDISSAEDTTGCRVYQEVAAHFVHDDRE